MYDLAEEKVEHVWLDRRGAELPSSVRDARAAAALLAMKLSWTALCSYRFVTSKHINLWKWKA